MHETHEGKKMRVYISNVLPRTIPTLYLMFLIALIVLDSRLTRFVFGVGEPSSNHGQLFFKLYRLLYNQYQGKVICDIK